MAQISPGTLILKPKQLSAAINGAFHWLQLLRRGTFGFVEVHPAPPFRKMCLLILPFASAQTLSDPCVLDLFHE
jgi:hypothetical protein